MTSTPKTPEAAMAAYVAAYQESAANMRTLLDAAGIENTDA